MKNYVGRKCKGFRFEYGVDGVEWLKDKEKEIGKVGLITKQSHQSIYVKFDFYSWAYPISLIEPHLVEDQTESKVEKETVINNTVICCDVLERMKISWMKLDDGSKCMPHIKGSSDENMYRINYCPSCGKHVRGLILKP
jgi:hypothetical protein